MPYQIYPCLCLFVVWCFNVVIPLRGEKAKDMLCLALRIALTGNGCEVREVYLVAKLCTVVIFVYGEKVWAQD